MLNMSSNACRLDPLILVRDKPVKVLGQLLSDNLLGINIRQLLFAPLLYQVNGNGQKITTISESKPFSSSFCLQVLI